MVNSSVETESQMHICATPFV